MPDGLSARVNGLLASAVSDERYQQALDDWADRLVAEHDLDAPEDRPEMERLERLLSGLEATPNERAAR